MAAPNEITASQLARLIGTPAAPTILDVRIDEDINTNPWVIPGSVRLSHKDVDQTTETLAGTSVVVVCHKGKKLSHGAAALLRAHGIQAEVLAGGAVDWAAQDLPCTPIKSLPQSRLWVTRQRPKIDRIACPWLIHRFVDKDADFLFVPTSEVLDVADRFHATPFDVEGCAFTHEGTECTFDALLKRFELGTAALTKMAQVFRAADTGDHQSAPEAAGLLAVSVGLSRQYRDDNAQLAAAMPLYDALYRWARDGQSETHAWPEGHKS